MTNSHRFAFVVGTALAAAMLCEPHEARADSAALGTIVGFVSDAETGAALAGVTIIATSAPTPVHPAATGVAVTDGGGHYAIPALAPGEYLLAFYYQDFQIERSGVRVVAFDQTVASQIIDLRLPPSRGGIVMSPTLPAVVDRTGGIGAIVGVSSRGVVTSGLRALFRVRAFEHPGPDYFRIDSIRLTPQVLYARDGTPHANDFAFGLTAEYFADLSIRIGVAGGIGGGVDVAQRNQGWCEARLTPTIRILRSSAEIDGHGFHGPYGQDVDLAFQLRLVHDLGDGRTSGIAEIGVDLLW